MFVQPQEPSDPISRPTQTDPDLLGRCPSIPTSSSPARSCRRPAALRDGLAKHVELQRFLRAAPEGVVYVTTGSLVKLEAWQAGLGGGLGCGLVETR